jgi:hypothetical protein
MYSKVSTILENAEAGITQNQRAEQQLLTELRLETIDLVDQVELTCSALNEGEVGDVRNAFFQVNPSATQAQEVVVRKSV